MEKKEFKSAELEVVRFEIKDIIMSSQESGGIKLPDHEW